MDKYRYEPHLHTCEVSKCASSSGAEFARHFKSLGYAGIFVTDHFLNGNTMVPEELPWPDRVNLFCKGYDEAAAEGGRIGLDVFFGWEYSYGWAHFLTYGLGKDWLLSHPDLMGWDLMKYFDKVHADGGFIVHAHPFREGVDLVHLVPGKTDAVEVVNGGRAEEFNRHARDYAVSHGLHATAGSDIHSTKQRRLCGISCGVRIKDAYDYIAALRSGKIEIFDENAAGQ